MPKKQGMLDRVVPVTLALLAASAMLVVLGICNAIMDWDLFGPVIEKVLYSVFASCLALAAFGVAMVSVLSSREIIRDFRAYVLLRSGEPPAPAPSGSLAGGLLWLVIVLGLVVGFCAGANHLILRHRNRVFARTAAAQVGRFERRLAAAIGQLAAPPRDHIPRDIFDLVKTLDDFDFICRTTLYLPDPVDREAMWGMTAWRGDYCIKDGFARFFVAKDFEKAMRKALDGDGRDLERHNRKTDFIWYSVVKDAAGKPRGIIRVDGVKSFNFREYRIES